MKDYELTVLVHPDLEMNPDPAIAKVKKLIEANGGVITNEEVEGKKRLSYSIAGQTFALYYYYDVQLPSDAPGKISAGLNIADEVLRHLLVRVDERKAKLAARRAEVEAKEAKETKEAKDPKNDAKPGDDDNTNSKEDN